MRTARCQTCAGLLALLVLVAGCDRKLDQILLPDSPPQLHLTLVPQPAPDAQGHAWLARWSTSAPRRAAHYLVALDPRSVDVVDASWRKTTDEHQLLVFPGTVGSKTPPGARPEPHVFAVRAVEASGTVSEPEWISFTGTNQPPIVQITNPVPNPAFTALVLPSVRIDWTGIDPDGQFTTVPVSYRFRLFGTLNPDFPAIPDFITFAMTNPDSLRALYAPDFPGWDSAPAETTSHQYVNLIPNSQYLFVVTGFDEIGDYDPVFSGNKNMLRMAVTFEGATGPLLSMFNQWFNYTYATGGWSLDPSRVVKVEVPADQSVTVNWTATPPPGSSIRWYRWVLDPADLFDETPRSNEETDLSHWSMRSANTTSATVGPFDPPGPKREVHRLYIEVEDLNGLRSLGIVDLIAVRPTFTGDLLIVDDTRLRPDFASAPGTIDPPSGPWPTSAELDTFLFARGGVPWHSYPGWNTPTPTLSTPGIFAGYAFDTLGTRGLINAVPLSVLASYRHVIWYTDPAGASSTSPPQDPSTPITALRLMCAPGRTNTLAAYVDQGGKAWLCGGGAAAATLLSWNRPGTPASVYTAADLELIPGRFMYDVAHWRTGITLQSAFWARRFGTTSFGEGPRPGRGWPGQPDYSLLPPTLHLKTGGDGKPPDPLPPYREGQPSWFYYNSYPAEFIHLSTFVREDSNDDPDVVEEISTLDTLYLTALASFGERPVMTYYHGRDHTPFVFSGFSIWAWKREECVQLVDFVLGELWGMSRGALARGPAIGPLPRTEDGAAARLSKRTALRR